MKVHAAQCNKCGDIIWSRCRHDFRWCTCKAIGIDGGYDCIRVIGDDKNIKELIMEDDCPSRDDAYKDWNESKDKYGLIPLDTPHSLKKASKAKIRLEKVIAREMKKLRKLMRRG